MTTTVGFKRNLVALLAGAHKAALLPVTLHVLDVCDVEIRQADLLRSCNSLSYSRWQPEPRLISRTSNN